VKEECNEDAIVVMVGNKADLEDEQKTVTSQMIDEERTKYPKGEIKKCFQVSAKTGEGVDGVYKHLA
jgi:GTPase SAR1 family protein